MSGTCCTNSLGALKEAFRSDLRSASSVLKSGYVSLKVKTVHVKLLKI